MALPCPTTWTVRAFRDAETAQVWAEDRQTGEPRYIGRGEADELREEARANWRCPVPGCLDDRISTRGGSRRDHFFHLGDGAGHSDGESLQHLQAKAMIAAWARGRAPSAVVEEERSIKDPVTRRTRRPDVLAQWPDGRRVAFEVEYKSWSVAAWCAKQDDFDGHGPRTRAVWLFGHLPRYLAQPPRPSHVPEGEWDRVLIREVPRAVAAAGLPVLHVNPLDRTIGTVVVDGLPLAEARKQARWYDTQPLDTIGLCLPTGLDEQGRLVVCSIDECELDPDVGLVTPTMTEACRAAAEVATAAAADRIRDAQRDADEQATRERARVEQERRDARPGLSPEDRRAYAQAAAERDRQRWLADPLRLNLVQAYGKVPPLLAQQLDDDRGVLGHHEHWHCIAFRKLIRGRVGRTWTVRQVYAVIAEDFTLHKDPMRRGPAISGFLDHLDKHRLVDFDATSGTVRVLRDDPMTAHQVAANQSRTVTPPPPLVTTTARDSREQARRIRLQMEEERRSKQGPSDFRRAAVDANGVRLFTIARLTEMGVDPAAAVMLAGIGIVPPLAPEVRRPF